MMGTIHRYPTRQVETAKCEVVDLSAELDDWRETLSKHDFFEPGTNFSHYEPSLVFAYDSYLQYHQVPLDELMQTLERKYDERFDRFARLNWHRMEGLLEQVWLRMGAPVHTARSNDMQAGWMAGRPAA